MEDKYSKIYKTLVSLDSNDRDLDKYIYANNYTLNLNKEFNNIFKIKLININVPTCITPINKYNNLISWIYKDDLDYLTDLKCINLNDPNI